MRKLRILFMALIAASTVACSSSDNGTTPVVSSCGNLDITEGDIAIVYTNDVHCGVVPVIDGEDVTNIGYAGVAAFANCVADATGDAEYVTLVDAGDSVQGDAIGTLSDGEYIVDIMNEVGYDVFVPGNHEFDYGMSQMQSLMGAMSAKVISSNFTDLLADETVFDAYTLKTYGDVTVAFVGITTPESFTKSAPKYFQDNSGNYIYGFQEGNNGADLYAAVQAAVDAAATQADYVIAIGHLGIDAQSAPWRSTDVIANTTGIDAFIDGHSHSTVEEQVVQNRDGNDVILTQTGTKLAGAGLLRISTEGVISAGLLDEFDEVDTDVDAFVDSKVAEFNEQLEAVVANSSVDLIVNDPVTTERLIRKQETNLGDLAADAYRYVLGNGKSGGDEGPADIAFVNGGGVRADIPAGDITFGQVIAVHPFNNVGTVVEATGQEILDALEMSARVLPNGENGGFLQVSGISFTIDTTIASTVELDPQGNFANVAGARRIKDVIVGVDPINPASTYTLASHNFMLLDGGDGINMFTDNTIVVQPVILDNQILISYIEDYLGGVVGGDYLNPYGAGRMNIIK